MAGHIVERGDADVSAEGGAQGRGSSLRRMQWVDRQAPLALRVLSEEDSRPRTRSAKGLWSSLPRCLYEDAIAQFLCFGAPLPNQLYAVGGRNQQQNPLDTVEMFDTWHGRWVHCPKMLSRRAGCAITVLEDGRLLVVGGYDERGIVQGLLDSCEIFDPVGQTWSPGPAALGRARWGHGCASLGGLVYAVGGCSLRPGWPAHDAFMETLRSCEVYDPQGGGWSPCAELCVARAGARVVALGGRCLAAVGGCDDVFGRAELLPTVELFDPSVGCWAMLPLQLSMPRTTSAVAALDDRQIVIVGGAPSLASGEVYSLPEQSVSCCSPQVPAPRASRMASIGDITEGRMGCQAVAMALPAPDGAYPSCTRQCVVVVGGESGDDDWGSNIKQFSSVLVYDGEDQSWRADDFFPPIPTPRTAMALCVGPGRIRSR